MDRDRHPRREQRGGAGGALGVEVPGADARTPAPDRQQRQVQVRRRAPPCRRRGRCRRRSRRGGSRAIRKPTASRAALETSARSDASASTRGDRDRRRPWRTPRAPAPTPCRSRGASRNSPAPGGASTGTAAVDPAQRRQVGVVVMQVGDQHRRRARVDARRAARGAVAAQGADPLAQHRVGEQPHAVELDQDGRVADPGHPVRGRHGDQGSRCVVGGA